VIEIVIVGAGGHGREAATVAIDSGEYLIKGFAADEQPDMELLSKYGYWLGTVDNVSFANVHTVIAIGSCRDKEAVHNKLVKIGKPFYLASLRHPTSYVGHHCKLGGGLMMYPGSIITTNVTTGLHVHLNCNSVVSHDCTVGDFSTISPGAKLNGNVTIGKGVFVGTGAVVLEKLTIGDWATIGAGAVVTKDVPPHETYVGIPARRMCV
jgi:sugar O-acyltransferase (sialic acid O-acetyltransferase NeuD family)